MTPTQSELVQQAQATLASGAPPWDAMTPSAMHALATSIYETLGRLLVVVGELDAEREQLNARCNAIVSGLEWTGDGYEWHPTHGDYRERVQDAVVRAAMAHEKSLYDARALLFKLARHIRNTDSMPAIDWGAHGCDLLVEVQAMDPQRYANEVSVAAAAGTGGRETGGE